MNSGEGWSNILYEGKLENNYCFASLIRNMVALNGEESGTIMLRYFAEEVQKGYNM